MSKLNMNRYTSSERKAEAEIDRYLQAVNQRSGINILEELKNLSA